VPEPNREFLPIGRPAALVVEDRPEPGRLVAEALHPDFRVSTAVADLDAALDGAPGDLDLVVTGVGMARMTGADVVAAVRRRPGLDAVPILLVSAPSEEPLRARLLREGAQDYVLAPFSPEELRARALNLATLKRTRDVLQAAVTSQSSDLAALARELAIQKERAEDAHRRADAAGRAKDEFLAVLSHELRTPLHAILGWTTILRRKPDDPATVHRAVEVIERNARVQARLVDDLLDVSAMVCGRMRLRLDPLPLGPVLAAAIDAVRPAAEAKKVHFEWHCAEGDLTVIGDGDRLRQVVYNLLANAIKFTPEGGRVSLRVGVDAEAIAIGVEDTGCGIPPDFLPHVFDRFSQAAGAGGRGRGGLGLGLAIVRHLAELHGGTVQAESDGEGRGARFTVRLPAARPQAAAPAGPAARAGGTLLLGLRILCLEREPEVRETIVRALEQHGAVVAAAATPSEAARLLDRFQPDLLLSDAGRPEEDGHALLELLHARGRRIPAIALTGDARPAQPPPGGTRGYRRYVGKPVDVAELVSAIATVAGSGPGVAA